VPVLLFISLVSAGAVFMGFVLTAWCRDGRPHGTEYLPYNITQSAPTIVAGGKTKHRTARRYHVA
jgi:hypothetical protein